VGASVRARLLNRARAEGRVFQELATLYAMERFLYRLGRSDEVENFILKGGFTVALWAGEQARVTRDIDLLGRGSSSVAEVVERIGRVLGTSVAPDGVVFDSGSLEGTEIAVETRYVGVRVRFGADLGGMRLHMQVDVGFGDAVVPPPDWLTYPELLDLGSPRVLGYPAAATLAEKLHAVCSLGLVNTRMKDYYDLWTGSRLGVVGPAELGRAVRHAFERRGTAVPQSLPEGLTAAFSADPIKNVQWDAFLRKGGLSAPSLAEVVEFVGVAVEEAFREARRG